MEEFLRSFFVKSAGRTSESLGKFTISGPLSPLRNECPSGVVTNSGPNSDIFANPPGWGWDFVPYA